MIENMAQLEKLEKILFYVFLFLIPFQIRTFLQWGGNEWNSVFVYLGDIILFLIFLLAVKRLKINKFQISNFKFQKTNLLLIVFLIIAGFSLLVSSNLEIGLFRFIKLLEFVLLYIYIRSAIRIYELHPNAPNIIKPYRIYQILIASGVFQSILAIGQFLKQSSLGLKFIEAGVFKPGAPGVATFIMENGEKVMRAYGSFPHPNVLAGFLLLGIFGIYFLWLNKVKNYWLLITSYGLLVFALFLTFSRTAIVIFMIGSLAMLIVRMFSKLRIVRMQTIKLFGLFLISCLISIAILFPYLQARFFEISFEEQAIDLRFFYNKMALEMIKEKPWLGVGIGNFVTYSENYPAYLRAAEKMLDLESKGIQGEVKGIPQWIFQPVHNIYLLIGAEMGIIGLIVFSLFIGTVLLRGIQGESKRNSRGVFLLLVTCYLLLAFTDHYFWTLQSGGLMFWLALALARNSICNS